MKANLKNFFIDSIWTIIGAAIMATGVSFFLLPNQLSSGGFSGIATITYYLFNFPMGITIITLNAPLFLFAIYKLGKGFFIKSIFGTVSLSVFIDLFNMLKPLTQDRFLACIYGGIITGLGSAIILKGHSSTGGSELVGNIIKGFKKNVRISNIIMIIDIVVVTLNVIFFKEIEVGLYSAIAIYLMGKIIDIVFEGIYFTKLILIISDKNAEIAKRIGNEVKRGTTGLYGKGMYTDRKKLILMCAVSRGDVSKVKDIARKVDSNCFMIVTNSREVIGQGF
ncbi:MAG: YitT family protein [Clostridia bacterium]|nr:YitT family protein [Clostridia bacterium]